MRRLQERADGLAQQWLARRVEQLESSIREAVPGASIEVERSQIGISGRGLRRRWLSEPALRFVAGLAR